MTEIGKRVPVDREKVVAMLKLVPHETLIGMLAGLIVGSTTYNQSIGGRDDAEDAAKTPAR